ncbi:hypothetical protein DY000_02060279 [Brassica cretica]|uniref:Uncharacterized protein n=1 Tax=Brassica cretica TaxID=69181 RepID=A0ABQ7AQT2_BRACR|nr:hypothetical protein DY000_02060279 [Brassica cretica]
MGNIGSDCSNYTKAEVIASRGVFWLEELRPDRSLSKTEDQFVYEPHESVVDSMRGIGHAIRCCVVTSVVPRLLCDSLMVCVCVPGGISLVLRFSVVYIRWYIARVATLRKRNDLPHPLVTVKWDVVAGTIHVLCLVESRIESRRFVEFDKVTIEGWALSRVVLQVIKRPLSSRGMVSRTNQPKPWFGASGLVGSAAVLIKL